ncbi:hypothetical protein T484DRAFT_1831871 [Baffinella frigidus]|nr:hypothetical protein T484DRAFT_1831871 [Cryptophyta sp. CCMP2293]
MEGKGMRVWALLALLALAGCADDEARDAARLYEEAVNAFALLTFGHASRSLAKFSDAAEASTPHPLPAYGMVRGQTRAHAGSESAPPPWARREAGVLEGKMHIEDNHWDEAIWAFERTYASHPDSSEALFRLLYLQHFSCNFTNRGSLLADARTRVPTPPSHVSVRGDSM